MRHSSSILIVRPGREDLGGPALERKTKSEEPRNFLPDHLFVLIDGRSFAVNSTKTTIILVGAKPRCAYGRLASTRGEDTSERGH